MKIDLLELEIDHEATVIQLRGGVTLQNKLSSLGIREGKKIKKIGKNFFRGPITVQVGQTRVAVGHSMAKKIIVES